MDIVGDAEEIQAFIAGVSLLEIGNATRDAIDSFVGEFFRDLEKAA